jgi:uncharacterized membrane protein YedE/YeeE
MQTWSWWAAGLGIGLTALGLAWFTGKKLGVTGGFEDACSLLSQENPKDGWKLFFILGLPLGGFLASGSLATLVKTGQWNWTLLFGQVDAFSAGSLWVKLLWLFIAGILVGYGARWAGGCVSGNSIMGVSTGSIMSIVNTVAFLVAGILTAHMIFKFFGVV